MSAGTWDPNSGAKANDAAISDELIKTFIGYSKNNQLDDIGSLISEDIQIQQRPLMNLEQSNWIDVGNTLGDDDTIHLIKFFTIAEMKLSGWDAGSKSPVIGLVKALKKRKAPPTQDLVLWIRENSSNRYLPHGPL